LVGGASLIREKVVKATGRAGKQNFKAMEAIMRQNIDST